MYKKYFLGALLFLGACTLFGAIIPMLISHDSYVLPAAGVGLIVLSLPFFFVCIKKVFFDVKESKEEETNDA